MPLFQENGLERCQVPMMPQGQPLEGGPSLQGHRPGPHGLHCALHYDGWSLQDNNSHQPSGPGEGTPRTEHSPGLKIGEEFSRPYRPVPGEGIGTHTLEAGLGWGHSSSGPTPSHSSCQSPSSSSIDTFSSPGTPWAFLSMSSTYRQCSTVQCDFNLPVRFDLQC